MKTRAEIDTAIAKILQDQLNVAHLGLTVTQDQNLFDDLRADSLDVVEIAMACEEEFGIEIPDAKLVDVATVRDLGNVVEACGGN